MAGFVFTKCRCIKVRHLAPRVELGTCEKLTRLGMTETLIYLKRSSHAPNRKGRSLLRH